MADWDIPEWGNENAEIEKENIHEAKKSKRRTVACTELSMRYEMRRAFSESNILDCIGIGELKNNTSYHFISAGDVDSLSFLKLILRHQSLKYCLLSTWCMSAEDIFQINEWVQSEKIKFVDFYVGEIFPGSYKIEYKMISDLIKEHPEKYGRIAVFKNHSKIITGYGDDFYFTTESSANINTNPRTENTVLTINKDLHFFYKNYFDGIISFEK